ncbi:YbaB/EbfC family nucleoid-associated protein [Nocardia mexicana]|uniref:YbaB/EbfC DNA-binding family protein n=1 Tax=Nocardia mexicana TaxID=279262 RepID=A0A370GI43_9NOCA|nr:YbaB/EbfC family nucleoid-associated protein [Nocardia mexicana]RDI43317.1 hypothetical protein DFR68_12280 [Nocardia mexicana]
MTTIPEWEQQLQHELAEIRRNSQQLANAVGEVRGRGELRGINVEVNADGDITSLQIAPGAMRWTSSQLTTALLDCHRHARTDARNKVKRLTRKADPRIREQLNQLQGKQHTPDPPRRPLSDDEAEAADDAYFQRMNRSGWTE